MTAALQYCQDKLIKSQRKAILILNDIFPPEMRGNWSIDKVTAQGDNKAGYR